MSIGSPPDAVDRANGSDPARPKRDEPARVRRLLALVLGLALGLALAEAGARLLVPVSAADELLRDVGGRLDDPVLGYRTVAGSGENDARGHRNERALERASVVALGDSQTWGVNAEIDESWPALLEERYAKPVYNMGRGGYAVLQYLHQLDDALRLEPEWIVVALYFGNDLYEAYSVAYELDAHAARRHPDPVVRGRIESSDYPDVQRMFFGRIRYQRSSLRPFQWLEQNTALGTMLVRLMRRPADAGADRAWAAQHPGEGFVYDGAEISTVFHSTYRLAAVDTSLERIREGLRITREALLDVAARVAREPGTELLVVLIPTKERIFARAVAVSGTPTPPSFLESVEQEALVAGDLTRLMSESGVRHLDLLPALEQAVARGEAIFPPNVDGHFTAEGYRVIANEVARRLDGPAP